MSEKLSCKSFDFLVKNGDNKDMWGTRFNQLVLLVSSFGLLLVFQNCGENAAVDPLIQNELLLSENQQICTDCSSAGSFLWLSIREYDPYKIDISTVTTHFFVSGQCGTSNFANHSFHWELREGFGAQNLVGRGTSDNRCDTGQFMVPIIPNEADLQPDRRYTLQLEIVGINNNGQEIRNPAPSNQGALDIIFTSEPPQ
jgi:hypothetical protein